jgi:hypothetical protein
MERRRRTILKKSGSPDISVEVYGTDGGEFSTIVDGKAGVIWPNYSPEQLKSGNTPPRTLDDAWCTLLSQYPDYSVGVVEDVVPA